MKSSGLEFQENFRYYEAMKLFWSRKSRKKRTKGLFGGSIRSDKEIQELNRKIKAHEKREGESAEASLEAALKNV